MMHWIKLTDKASGNPLLVNLGAGFAVQSLPDGGCRIFSGGIAVTGDDAPAPCCLDVRENLDDIYSHVRIC